MTDESIPYGYCQCGCGATTNIATRNRRDRGWIKSEPQPFAPGHNRGWRIITAADYTIEDRGFTTPCWAWANYKGRDGYGACNRSYGPDDPSYPRRAHIISYIQFVGTYPVGLEIDHLCAQRDCINPAHLEPVTRAENLRRSRLRHGPIRNAKLSHALAAEIRERRAATGESYPALARIYGVSQGAIALVI